MAKNDYEDLDFASRVAVRAEIRSLNKQLGRIYGSIGMEYNVGHNYIMDCFYGRVTQKVLDDYTHKVSPINSFGLETLTEFKYYLENVVEKWATIKTKTQKEMKHRFENLVNAEASETRKICKHKNCLPEFYDNYPELPTKITDSILKHAYATLKKAEQEELEAFDICKQYHLKERKVSSNLVQQFAQYAKLKTRKNEPLKPTASEKKNNATLNLFNYNEIKLDENKENSLRNAVKYISEKSLKLDHLLSKRDALLSKLDLMQEQPAYRALQNLQDQLSSQGYTQEEIEENEEYFLAKGNNELEKMEAEQTHEQLLAINQEIEELDKSIYNYMKRNDTNEQELGDYILTK